MHTTLLFALIYTSVPTVLQVACCLTACAHYSNLQSFNTTLLIASHDSLLHQCIAFEKRITLRITNFDNMQLT
jgi:hypothetical protein